MRKQPVKRYLHGDHLRRIADPLKAAFRAVVMGMTAVARGIFAQGKMLFTKSKALEASKPAYAIVEIQGAPSLGATLPVQRSRLFLSHATESLSTNSKWGWLPEIALLQSVSLLLLAWTFVAARAGVMWAEVFFWIGLASLIAPVAIRLYSPQASRRERIALIVLLGAAFYLVKVMHSPYAFTFPDEFSTFRNVREILQNHRLFETNPELPATALYPGLATVTSILVSLSGLATFPAGLLVIGAARLVLFLALFLLYERVSGSARIGGMATLFYMANTNFLFYTAEFSYESLALPMAIFVLYIVARRETTNGHRLALTVVALSGVFMVVISHHMTSYILTILLFAATGISIVRTRGRQRGPWDLALITAVATSFWLVYVATYTIKYLSPVLFKAVRSILRLAVKEETSRQLFKSSSYEYVSPGWEQLIVYCSILIIALGLPVGWWNIWSRYRNQIFFLLLGVVGLGFLPMQALRLTSSGWETANRSSEFLFIGLAFVLALAIDQIWRSGWIRWKSIWIQVVVVIVLIFGGFIAGWPPQVRMSRPYLVDTGSHIVQPQSVEVANWAFDYLGPDHHIATSKAGSKVFSAYGEQAPFTGGAYGIKHVLFSNVVGPNEVNIIRNVGIEYIASDRQTISWDYMLGYFFLNRKSSPSYEFLEFETYEKFDSLQGVNRILDSGNIVLYDVRVYLQGPLEVQETRMTAIPVIKLTPAVETPIDQPGSADAGSPESEVQAKDQREKGLISEALTVEFQMPQDPEIAAPTSKSCIHCLRHMPGFDYLTE